MRIASSVSTASGSMEAAKEAISLLAERLDLDREGVDPAADGLDLVFVFLTPNHLEEIEAISSEIHRRLAPRALVGVSAESVVGDGEELLDVAAVSLWGARLPGVEITTAHLRHELTADGIALHGLPSLEGDPGTLFVFNDPFSFRVDDLIDRVALEYPGVRIVGGMSSSAEEPGGARILVDDEVFDEGAASVFVRGEVEIATVVSQGCRPFGRPLVVTRCEGQIIHELGGGAPFQRFSEQAKSLDPRELAILARGLHLGRAVDSARASDGEGQFLIRHVLGFDKDSGAMVIGDRTALGETVQFHLRDPDSAGDELRALLERARDANGGRTAGALLFTCSGRGTRLFEEPHHDSGAIRERFGKVPIAGFFAGGEIGPIGGENCLHGFTAVVVLFSSPERSDEP